MNGVPIDDNLKHARENNNHTFNIMPVLPEGHGKSDQPSGWLLHCRALPIPHFPTVLEIRIQWRGTVGLTSWQQLLSLPVLYRHTNWNIAEQSFERQLYQDVTAQDPLSQTKKSVGLGVITSH